MLFSSCVTTQISTRIASVHTKQDLLSEFGYPHKYLDIPQGQIWDYYNLKGDRYASYWIDIGLGIGLSFIVSHLVYILLY
jgi:hypothetical protein